MNSLTDEQITRKVSLDHRTVVTDAENNLNADG